MTGSLESIRTDPRKKIAIVGKAPSSLALAPYSDESWQIWTLSDLVLCKQAPRYDVHFELHETKLLVGPRKPYVDWLGSIEKPLIVRAVDEHVPNGIAYPMDEIVAKFGGYFTNTVSWMIALAIDINPDEIGVWGVDMACTEEYRAQRPSCEYFLGIAAGRGIKVTVPQECDLLKCFGLYGFDPKQSDFAAKHAARTKEIEAQLKAKSSERDNTEQSVSYLRGCVEYCGEEAKKKELQDTLAKTEERLNVVASECLYLQGALEDCRDYWGQWARRM